VQGLNKLRVLDFSSWVAGPYASKLFADAGADVIKIETPAGDPMRCWTSAPETPAPKTSSGGKDAPFFQFLNGSKRSVVYTAQDILSDTTICRLIESADLLIEDLSTNHQEALQDRFPHLVILSITPYGRSGPYANRPATEFTIQAESGSIAGRGMPSETPYTAGGRITDFVGGTYAAVAALAAVRRAQATGTGEYIDFSLLEVMQLASNVFMDLMFSLMNRPVLSTPPRTVEIPSIEPSRDGWVGFNTNSRQQYNDFLIMIERPDLHEDRELATVWGRAARMEEWNHAVRHWTRQHTTAEIVEKASLFRIPVAPVNHGQSVLEHEQFVVRQVFEKNPAGNFLQPRPPYRINGQRPGKLTPAPTLGEHSERIEPRTRLCPPASQGGTARSVDLPLHGIRILDATTWWAGPSATQMLATLGAEVIHLESVQRPDGARYVAGAFTNNETWWEWSAIFAGTNTNKRSLTLDLNHPRGLSIVKQLIRRCDVVIENFSPRVFENFGLDWESIHKINARTLFVRMPAFGLDGPWRDNVGFAQTMEQMTGLAWVTGHVDDQPRIQRGPCDPLAGMHAAFATLVGLAERDTTGEGQFIECTMVEGALNAAAEQVIEYTAHGRLLQRNGNRCATAAPQGLYACRGDDNWLALSIETETQWQALVEQMGHPSWAQEESLDSISGRSAAHDAIDRELAQWARGQDLEMLVTCLIDKGVPAATLLDGRYAYLHPQLVARKFFESVHHPITGKHPTPAVPFRFSSREAAAEKWITRAAPTLGQHNHEILSDWLGLSAGDITELEDEEIIGTQPLGL